MRFRSALVAAGAALAVAVGPLAFPSIASATPVEQPNLYATHTVDTSAPSMARDYVTYNGVTYLSAIADGLGRAIFAIPGVGQDPVLISHTDVGTNDGNSGNIHVNGHYLFYTNQPVAYGDTNIYVVDLDTNTTTQLNGGSSVVKNAYGITNFASVGSKTYFSATDSSDNTELFSFDTTDASLTAVVQASRVGNLVALGNKIYYQVQGLGYPLAVFNTTDNTLSTTVAGVDGNRIMGAWIAGKYTFQGHEGIIYSQDDSLGGYYSFLDTDGNATRLGNWRSKNYNGASFVNVGADLYTYHAINIWGTEWVIAKLDSSGNEIDESSVVSPTGVVRVANWEQIDGQLVFIGSIDGTFTQYLYKWDGTNAAVKVNDFHSTSQADDFFRFPVNTNITDQRELGVVGNTALANAFMDDSAGFEPYEFGLDGSVTLVKNFAAYENGLQPGCLGTSGDTDYIVGTTPSIDPAKNGGTLAIFKGSNRSLKYSVEHMGGLGYPCGFANIGSNTYFSAYSWDLGGTKLYRLNSDYSVTVVANLPNGQDNGPAFSDGSKYYYYIDGNNAVERLDITTGQSQAITGDDGNGGYLYGIGQVNFRGITAAGNTLYINAYNNDLSTSMVYSLDMSSGDSVPVLDGSGYTYVTTLTTANGVAYFAATSNDTGRTAIYSVNPSDNTVADLADNTTVDENQTWWHSTWVNSIQLINGVMYLGWFNSNTQTTFYYTYTAADGLQPLSLGVNVTCLASAGTEVAVSDASGNIYLYDTSGVLQKLIQTTVGVCGAFSTDRGSYLSVPKYNRTGDSYLGNEIAYLGMLAPQAVNRFGAPVSEFPSLPYTGDAPAAETTVPGAPTSVVGSAGDGVINVNWEAPTDGGLARDYSVSVSPAGPTCEVGGTGAVCSGTITGVTYKFKVKALNGAGSSGWSAQSAGVVGPMTAPTPTIVGNVNLTQTITAGTTGWSAGTKFTYQWFKDAVAIPGETNKKYVIKTADLGHAISVTVTGSLAGYGTRTKTTTSQVVANAKVTLIGVAKVGNKLKVDPGIWGAGYALSYQWYDNNTAISGATGTSYLVQPDDIQSRIRVLVTGSKIGAPTLAKFSNTSKLVLLGSLASTPVPYISGQANVDGYICADEGSWDNGVSTAYQWYRNGHPIDGETSDCYYPTAPDLGQIISAKVTGSKYGYIPKTMTSNFMRVVLAQFWGTADTPVISGDAVAGNTLSVDIGNVQWFWGNVSYQWLDGSKPIKGATDSTYTIPSTKVGHQLSVRVTVSKPYYVTQKATSDLTAAVTN